MDPIRNALLITTCLSLAALAGAQDGSAPKAGPDDSAARILDSSPPIIQPQWTRAAAAPAAKTQAGQLVDVRARIVKIPGANWYMVRYEAGPAPPLPAGGSTAIIAGASTRPSGKPPRPQAARSAQPPAPQLLLPCRLLEQVESSVTGEAPPLLKVSGETTWYHKKSFLLLGEVTADSGDAPPPSSQRPAEANSAAGAAPPPQASPLTDLAGDPSADANQAVPAPPSRPSSGPAAVGAEASDILNILSGERPGKNLASGAPPPMAPASVPSVAPPPAQGTLSAATGPMIVDRIVQIYPDGKSGWWAVHFLGDNTLREPPIRLLPCAFLEEAENTVAGSAQHLKFRVSGETTDYKGRKYMLLRKLLVEKDLGQL